MTNNTRRKVPVADRFAKHVVTVGPPDHRPGLGPCHEWTASQARGGYGAFGVGRKTFKAHRWSYEHHIGPIPEGMVIDHLCRNRLCVNPAHLEVVTHYENLRRGKIFRLRNGMDSACIHGHEYTPENTYVNPNTGRVSCRECSRLRDRLRYSIRKNRKATT